MLKKKTLVGIALILLMTSILVAIPINPVKAGLLQTGGTPQGTSGDPNLKPLASGVTPAYTIETTAYMSLVPSTVGLHQAILGNIWTSPGMYHCFYMCDYEVTVQKPDGSTETIGPLKSYMGDATAWFSYEADQVGTYRFKFEHPGTYLPVGTYVDRPGTTNTATYNLGASVHYTPSSTDWQNVTVQQDVVSAWPGSQIPGTGDYWTRPISPENREWYTISGWYPWSGIYYYANGRMLYPSNYRYTAYVQAPETAHIVWRRQGALSGLVGGDTYTYSQSSGGGTPPIIYAGRCYQSITDIASILVNGTYVNQPTTVWQCYDLRTGQVYWEQTGLSTNDLPTEVLVETPGASTVAGAESTSYSISLVAITNPSSTQPGRLIKYNPYTGAITSNVTCQPVGVQICRPGLVSPGGELGSRLFNLSYVYSLQTVNSSLRYLIKWDARGTSATFASRILSNVTTDIRSTSLGGVDYEAGICISPNWANPPGPQWCIGYNNTGYNLNTGKQIWNYATNDTLVDNVQTLSSPVAYNGKFALAMQNLHWSCWDARTGTKLWDSETTDYPWGTWWAYATASYDFNESKAAIIACAYDGVYAFDWDNGKILWKYSNGPSVPFEGPYGTNPFFTGVRIADGKIYAFSGEHSPGQPVTRGWTLNCIDAATGKGLWSITGPMSPGAVADGYLTASNSYDGYMYVFGKGKSATTVTAPNTVVPKGTGIVISGSVLDLSPAQPNTPCVESGSMATQMEYLHMQHSIDGIWHNLTITGVPVALTAIAADGSVTDIGSTTTNGYYGNFGYTWTPPAEGQYTIMASFAGDGSYGSSAAACTVSVGSAPSVAPTVTQQAEQVSVDNSTLLYAILAGVIIAIILAVMANIRKK